MNMRIMSVAVALFFVFSAGAQAEEELYSELTCAELLELDTASQEKAIDWLIGYVSASDLMVSDELDDKPYSVTQDACKAQPDEMVAKILRSEL